MKMFVLYSISATMLGYVVINVYCFQIQITLSQTGKIYKYMLPMSLLDILLLKNLQIAFQVICRFIFS